MIQIAAAIKPGANITGTTDPASAGDSASSFLAQYARTLSRQDEASSKAANPLDALLPGASDKTGSGSTADSSAGSDPALDLTSLSLMQALVVPGMVAMPDKATPQLANAGSDKQAGIAALGQDSGKGQSLPNMMATLAGQRAESQLQVQLDSSSQTNLGASNQGKAEMSFLDALTAKVSAAAIAPEQAPTKTLAQANADVPAGSVPPLAGQVSIQVPVTTVVADKPVITMQSSFGSPGWSQELGDKVVWMSNSQGHMSQLVLNPPSMGAVEIRLQLNGADAGAQFYSANADVRNALEAAMPKLREMLAGAGINLGQTTVSNQSFSQRDGYQQSQQKSSDGSASGLSGSVAGIGSMLSASSFLGAGTSLLDYYA